VPGFTGTDSFRYTVTDDNGGVSMPATVYVRVNVPTAADDLASFSGTTPTVIDVLANDTDPDGNQHLVPSSVTLVSGPQHGTATVNADGSITYTAAAGFAGTDTFRYTVMDDNGATSAPATVTVVGSAPNTSNGTFDDTDGTTPVSIPVLASDSAPGNAPLVPASVVVTAAPKHGSVTVDPVTGDITYTASTTFVGTDTFQYTVAYGSGVVVTPPRTVGGKVVSAKTVIITKGGTGGILPPATVSVRVNRPVAADDWTDTDGTTPVTIDVLANDSDPDGNQHIDPTQHTGAFVTRVSSPQHGTAALNADGSFTYTAVPGFTGTDSFRYTVTDDNGGVSMPATIYVRVNVPTAADDFAQAAGTVPVVIAVLANDTDPDGNNHLVPGSVTIVGFPQHGVVSVDHTTGQVTYIANAGWSGADRFRYTVSDDNGATSAPATVLVNTAIPVVASGFGVTSSQQSITFAVLASASDSLGSHVLANAIVTVNGAPQHGSVTVDAKTHQITYVPNTGFMGVDSFSYTITDASGAKSLPAVLTVRVLPPAPAALLVIEEQFYVTQYDTSLNGSNKHPFGL
jgi:large repetitive protein